MSLYHKTSDTSKNDNTETFLFLGSVFLQLEAVLNTEQETLLHNSPSFICILSL